MASSKTAAEPTTPAKRRKSSPRTGSATSHTARKVATNPAKKPPAAKPASGTETPVALKAPSAYGHTFWSRAGILSGLALGILILVQVNADRPADTGDRAQRSMTTAAATGDKRSNIPLGEITRDYPPAGFKWHPPAPGFHARPTQPPGYGYYPQYRPWPPAGTMPPPGYRRPQPEWRG